MAQPREGVAQVWGWCCAKRNCRDYLDRLNGRDTIASTDGHTFHVCVVGHSSHWCQNAVIEAQGVVASLTFSRLSCCTEEDHFGWVKDESKAENAPRN